MKHEAVKRIVPHIMRIHIKFQRTFAKVALHCSMHKFMYILMLIISTQNMGQNFFLMQLHSLCTHYISLCMYYSVLQTSKPFLIGCNHFSALNPNQCPPSHFIIIESSCEITKDPTRTFSDMVDSMLNA